MEDMFEALFALAVIAIPLLLKKKDKDKKKEKPGKAPRKQPAKKEFDWQKTFAEVEKKLSEVMDELEETAEQPEAVQEQISPMQPQRLQPEPLIPQILQEKGMGEGVSRTDDAGCVGGSLPHPEDQFHQGEDFQDHGEHTFQDRRQPVLRVERARPQVSAAELRQAVLWKEILDAPVSMRE